MTQDFKVAVLMGGPSGEHDISLRSGQGVVDALTRRHWPVEPIVIPRTHTMAEAGDAAKQALTRAGADVVFIALHGPFGEDGTIQTLCESLRLPYTGSTSRASRLGMDKVASKMRLEQAGLVVPRGTVIASAARPDQVNPALSENGGVKDLAYPLVIKPVGQGSSLGVSIVHREEDLPVACEAAGRFGDRIVIEEFVIGRELTVGVLGKRALPIVEMRPRQPFFDYAAKYTEGLTDYLVPAPLPPGTTASVQAAGLRAHQALGCRHFSRTDLILSPESGPVILEVNTIPGLTPMSLLPRSAACVQISYDELCEQIVMMALHKVPRHAQV